MAIGWVALAVLCACCGEGDRGTCGDGVRQAGEVCYGEARVLAGSAPNPPSGVRVRDIDGDGDLDLTFVDRPPGDDPTASYPFILQLAENEGGASFGPPRALATNDVEYYELVRRVPGQPLDVVALTIPGIMLGDTGTLSLLTQTQPLTFEHGAFPGEITAAKFLAARDLDGDGDDDLVVVTDAPGWQLLDNVAGTWRAGKAASTTHDGVSALRFGDADGNGVPDLLGLSLTALDVSLEHLAPEIVRSVTPIHLSLGTVAFVDHGLLLSARDATAGVQLDTYLWPRYEIAIDLDNDAAEDLFAVVGERGSDDHPEDPTLFAVLLRNRAGVLQPGRPFGVLGDRVDLREKPTFADVNGDGQVDIVFSTVGAVRALLSEP